MYSLQGIYGLAVTLLCVFVKSNRDMQLETSMWFSVAASELLWTQHFGREGLHQLYTPQTANMTILDAT